MFLISLISSTWHTHLTLLNLIFLIIFGKKLQIMKLLIKAIFFNVYRNRLGLYYRSTSRKSMSVLTCLELGLHSRLWTTCFSEQLFRNVKRCVYKSYEVRSSHGDEVIVGLLDCYTGLKMEAVCSNVGTLPTSPHGVTTQKAKIDST
jgi:hypothetical protein